MVRKLAPGVHQITEMSYVHTYLVEGQDRAVLIDSGLGVGHIRTVAETLTESPVIVVNTHAHWDHIGGDHLFDTVAIHQAEVDLVEQGVLAETMRAFFAENPQETQLLLKEVTSGPFEIRPSQVSHALSHGEVLDLGGGRRLEVFHTPGHTPGSICLLDESARFLFTGDTVYAGRLSAHWDDSDLGLYAESVKTLQSIGWDINLVFPSHGETPLDGGILLEVGSGFERLMDGEGVYETALWKGREVFDVNLGRFSVRVRERLRKG